MFLIKIAFKNLTRHRKRTLITASIIASAILVFLFTDSLLLGLNNASYDNIINYSTSEIQIVDKRYWNNRNEIPLNNLINTDQNIINELESNNNIKGISKKLEFQARLNNGVDELPVKAVAVEGENIDNTLSLKDSVIEGSFFNGKEYKAVLGKPLAELMNLEHMDYITLLIRTKEDTFNTIELEISGIINSPNPNVNQNNVYLPLDIAQNALNLDDEFSHILVKVNNSSKINSIASDLKNNLLSINNNLKVVPWNELTAVSVMNSKQGANQAILAIILLLAAIGIINTVILSALERMEEIGMMKAMGMKRIEIIYSFVLESTGLGIIGGIIGCLLGAIAVSFLNIIGIDYASLFQIDIGNFGIPIADRVYGAWNISSFIFVFIFSVIVSMVASIFPAYWAANKNPVDAIHPR